jgi:hypothetical protein
LQNAQKYQPLTFIFDVGGSFQSLTTIYGRSYLNVGHESRDFNINPFSLPSTKENRQFLFSFFRVPVNFFLCVRFPFREIPLHKADNGSISGDRKNPDAAADPKSGRNRYLGPPAKASTCRT